VSSFLLVVGVVAAWLLLAMLLALALGRTVAVARAHDERRRSRVTVTRGSLARRTTTAVLHRAPVGRSR
jgi:hypothetical protein